MNSPKAMLGEDISVPVSKTEKRNKEEEAEKVAYRKDNGELYVPATAIKGCLVNASSYRKFGKYSAKPILSGGVFITPHEIGLGTKKYDIDVQTVVIQRARVPKARPVIKNWKLSFTLEYDEKLIGNSILIKPILEDAGKRVGILDFRPQKLGSFGRFKVTKWQEQ
jgi:hypothetical protein